MRRKTNAKHADPFPTGLTIIVIAGLEELTQVAPQRRNAINALLLGQLVQEE